MSRIFIATIISFFVLSQASHAARTPRVSGNDHRIRYVTYHDADVVNVKGNYSYSTTIEFEKGESVVSFTMGDSTAWQVQRLSAFPHVLSIKPTEPEATTNMTVFTNKRIYTFLLEAHDPKTRRKVVPSNPQLTFRIKFKYPTDMEVQLSEFGYFDIAKQKPAHNAVLSGDFSDLNFNYTFSGKESLRPIHAFDNGTFTYFEFHPNAKLPAFFAVDDAGNESLVNYNRVGRYIVVETLSKQFTLRSGENAQACIFNEDHPNNTPVVQSSVPYAENRQDSPFDALKEFKLSSLFTGKVEYIYPNKDR